MRQAGRAAGVVVTRLAWLRAQDPGHQEADLGRREEFAGALAGTLCELAEEVLVGATEEVGLHIGES
jgi:hypothetical protein